MNLSFQNKIAVVTGGVNGIGNACARLFAESGARVWILDTENENPANAAAAFGARGLSADVTDARRIEAALGEIVGESGGIDVIAINAGIVRPAALLDATPEDWQRTVDVNLTGAFNTLRAAARVMRDQRRGSIVFTASTNSFDGEGDLIAYNATKAGIMGLLHTAANELGLYGIRVNAVCPGLIRTRITQTHFNNPAILKDYFRHIPLGRGGEPAEVAAAVVFLASEAASFITGAALLVDGGQMATKFGPWNEDIAEFAGGRWTLR